MNKNIKGIMIAAILMLLITPFMQQPWLSYTWQLPDEDYFVIHTNILNWQKDSQDDIYVVVNILDLGIVQRSGTLDMDENTADSRTVYIRKPHYAAGEYLASISLYGKNSRLLDRQYTYLYADSGRI